MNRNFPNVRPLSKRIVYVMSMLPAFAVFLIVQSALAQQAGPSASSATTDDRETVKLLLKRIDELEARVKDLEEKQNKSVSVNASSSTSANSAKDSTKETSVDVADKKEVTAETRAGQGGTQGGSQSGNQSGDMHDSMPSISPTLRIRGFGDVQYLADNQKGNTNAFVLGQLDLFITSQLSEKVNFVTEMVVESDDKNAFGVELERMMLQYSHNDYFNIAVGRYHTAIGYYNTEYHHGTWFQTAVGRPFLFNFEDDGGPLPVHGVGLTANGRIPSGKLGLHYVAEVSNGRTSHSSLAEPVQNVVDENNGKAVNLAIYARPDWVPGLQAGFSVYRDHLTPDGQPKIGETIMAGHVVYTTSDFEFLNEVAVIRHTINNTGITFDTPGGYSQISRRFGKIRPYFRYEYFNAANSEPVYHDIGRRNGPMAGIRYDFNDFAAFKIQYNRTDGRQTKGVNGVAAQVAFTF